MSVDVIGDFLTIIRNGIMVSKQSVAMPYSNMRFAIAEILKQEGFIKDAIVAEDAGKKRLKVVLKYVSGESVIHELKRVSTPGRRYHAGATEIKPVVGGLGLSIITTNRGVMSHKKAQQLSVGGEVLCTVW